MHFRVLATGILLLLSGCVNEPLTVPSNQIVPAGFVCDLSPSEAYSPGYVYRLDKAGARWLTEDFSPSTKPRQYSAIFGSYNAEVTYKAGIVANLLSPVGSVEAGVGSSRVSKVTFSNAAFLMLTDVQEEELLSTADRVIKPRTGSRYFVVRDAIRARGIDIELSASNEARLGGEATIANAVKLTPNLSLVRSKSLTIKGEFSSPLNVCIRAVELVPSEVAADEGVSAAPRRLWAVSGRVLQPAAARRIVD